MDANLFSAVCVSKTGFNPRARDGREQVLQRLLLHRLGFNPRARDGREITHYITQFSKLCFNPRARDGRETFISDKVSGKYVSIHAPVMDAKFIYVR